jgi:hypothetical protein
VVSWNRSLPRDGFFSFFDADGLVLEFSHGGTLNLPRDIA